MEKQLVINWHVLEKCNFSCRYCFAHWATHQKQEVWACPERREKLLLECQKLSSIVPPCKWSNVRINIAGGEPMLLWRKGNGVLEEIFSRICELGFHLSIISNGFLMEDAFIRKWSPYLQILGISVDSTDSEINSKIGRHSKSSRQISTKRVAEIFHLARLHNPNIQCKLNTVVNAFNYQEDMYDFVKEVAPNRWKVFKMLPIADTSEIADKQSQLEVSDEQFRNFINRHKRLESIMMPEDNDMMTDSYVMIDPLGRFYQNTLVHNNSCYQFSQPIHKVGVEKAFHDINFSSQKFYRRYQLEVA